MRSSFHEGHFLTYTKFPTPSIYLFGHCNRQYQHKAIYDFTRQYWRAWFPNLGSYQAFNRRLNQLEPNFQALVQQLWRLTSSAHVSARELIIDSFPIILASGSRSRTARVAREYADQGWCAAKKLYFHGVRLHCVARRRTGTLPLPQAGWLREASCHDLTALRTQPLAVCAAPRLLADKAYADTQLQMRLAAHGVQLCTPPKQPKGGQLTAVQQQLGRGIASLRQPIESLFKWLNDKTDLQRASAVRSSAGLFLHCIGKFAVALILLIFYS
jgi:hypothetical protein